jgi:hypothetical protein
MSEEAFSETGFQANAFQDGAEESESHGTGLGIGIGISLANGH